MSINRTGPRRAFVGTSRRGPLPQSKHIMLRFVILCYTIPYYGMVLCCILLQDIKLYHWRFVQH